MSEAIPEPAGGRPPPAIQSPNQRAWRRFRRNRLATASGLFLFVVVLLALVWPLFERPGIASHLPKALTWPPTTLSDAQFQPPGAGHWFGTDVHGRDLLSRVIYGARISLLIGAFGAAVSLAIGVSWGAIAGYAGGRADSVMMRVVDVLYSLPNIIFVIVLIATFENPMKAWLAAGRIHVSARWLLLFVGLGAVSWLTMARIVRGQVLSLRTRPFVDASRALGASHARILLRHILPNIYGIIITYLTLTVPSILLYESFLSYLGLGIQPPEASLGSLIAEGAAQINPIRIYWWMIVLPGFTLTSTLLALYFHGDGLRDAWDPQTGSE
ncbi:MAG: ABC transporter permease [Verrucomicrobia bacterium]|nr:MAG: ABC transporter permease [Verrucomicrobiota bacterium]